MVDTRGGRKRRCCASAGAPPKRQRRPAPAVVILDNDECLGSFGLMGEFYCLTMAWLWRHHGGDRRAVRRDWERLGPELVHCCAEVLRRGVLRPGVVELLRTLRNLRDDGMVQAVVMYTSASDACWQSRDCPKRLDPDGRWCGYVRHFLRPCIEAAAETPGLYAAVLHRDNVRAEVTPDGATLKDFANVLERLGLPADCSTARMLFVDDRTQNIRDRGAPPAPQTVCRVPPYERGPTAAVLNVWYRNVQRALEGRPDVQRSFERFVERCGSLPVSGIVTPAISRAERAFVRRVLLRRVMDAVNADAPPVA